MSDPLNYRGLDEAGEALCVAPAVVRDWMNREVHPLPHLRPVDGRLVLFPREGVRIWLLAESRTPGYSHDMGREAVG